MSPNDRASVRTRPLSCVASLARACVALLTVATAAGCGGSGSVALAPQQAARTWQVQAGASSDADAFDGLDYYPSTPLTIDAGDAVRWTYVGDEPHTVTLLGGTTTKLPSPEDPSVAKPAGGSTYDGSAYVSSGLLAAGATYSLRFTKPGTYRVYCLIHQPEMAQTIVVQLPGTPYPQQQAAYSAAGAAQSATDLANARMATSAYPYAGQPAHFAMGIAPGSPTSTPTASTVLRFLVSSDATDQTATVPVGTTVTWTNLSNNEPHTVTFGPAGQPFPSIDPFAPASGGTTYDGSATVNSGPLFVGQSVSFTFTKAGTYTYHCLFHDDSIGMISTLVVR